MTDDQRPAYDTYIPGRGGVGVKIAHTLDDVAEALLIRGAVFVGEQNCPVREEMDGNDVSSTHLIAYKDDEPVATTRMRFFADFAHWGRLAVLEKARGGKVAFALSRAAVDLARDKGWRKIYGQAELQVIRFYERFGARILPGSESFTFSDEEFVEMVIDLEPSNSALSISSGPYTLIRPEGRWRRPGVLDASATRGVGENAASSKVDLDRIRGAIDAA